MENRDKYSEFQLELKQVVDVINAYVNLDERVFMKAPPDFEEQGKGLWPFGSDHLIAPMINFREGRRVNLRPWPLIDEYSGAVKAYCYNSIRQAS